MGLTVTAEGVEDRNVLELLRRLGCDHVQGLYVSPPLAAAELERWCRESAESRPAAARALLH
jgi:EAL domain-containing protein (putative c-di-GMP-specific phosphodiesterase class I)